MLSAQLIVLNYVCPSLGTIMATVMFAAPINSLKEAMQRGFLGHLNPLPWIFMTGNCIGWIGYSFLIHDYFVLASNAPGLFISVWLNFGAVKLQYNERQMFSDPELEMTKETSSSSSFEIGSESIHDAADDESSSDTDEKMASTTSQEKLFLLTVILWVFVFSIVAFAPLSPEPQKLIVGVVVNLNLMFFYGAPLSTIATVVRTRNSSPIHFSTMVLNLTNTSFWLAYGFAIKDHFILIPNGVGLLLGIIQGLLCLIFPRLETHAVLDSTHREASELNLSGALMDDDVYKSSDVDDTSRSTNPMIV